METGQGCVTLYDGDPSKADALRHIRGAVPMSYRYGSHDLPPDKPFWSPFPFVKAWFGLTD